MPAAGAALALLALTVTWTVALAIGGFAAHMTAHVAAVAVAPPLLVLGRKRRPGFLAAPMAPLAACAVELVIVWGWHVPALHAAARGSLAVFALEQLSFLLAGYGVWASALPSTGGGSGRSPALSGAGALLVTSMHMTLLGGLLAVSSRSPYEHAAVDGAPWDQQLGGVIMLAVGGTAYLIGGLALLARALGEDSGWKGVG